MKYINKIIIIILLIIIFYYINKFINYNENYTGLKTKYFFDNLKDNNYQYDDEKNIIKCDNMGNNCKKTNYKLHFNTIDAIKLVKNKVNTSELLHKNKISVPKYNVININDQIDKIIVENKYKNISFPLIIKPINGTFGKDVFTNLENKQELLNVINTLKKKNIYTKMMVENFIEGHVYRVFVFNNTVIDVIQREKPFIIGNGYDSVDFLIKERNKYQINNGFFETTNIGYDYIEKQGYTLNSILENGEKIFITNVINMHNGAVLKRINISSIPRQNINLFLNVGKILKINCYGLDYISNDITSHYKNGQDVILEVNGTPDTEIHSKIDNYGNTFFKNIVKKIF